jgi:hypothetical protein
MAKNWTDIYLDLDTKKIALEMGDGVDVALEIAAQRIVDLTETKFMNLTQGSGSGEMLREFFDFKSFYKDGGWVAGVFGSKSGPWTETVGGRAHFFEYGRSAPGKGKGKGGPQPISQRPQPPRPFIRPARNQVKRELGGITGKEIARVAARLNRHPELNRGLAGFKI